MGSEIVILAILVICAGSIAWIAFRMALTKRKTAFLSASVAGILSLAPLFFNLGPKIFFVFELELLTAFAIGSTALIYAHRWRTLLLFVTPCLFYLFNMFDKKFDSLSGTEFTGLVAAFSNLMAPVFLTLAVVFFVGAFVEKRRVCS